MCIETGFDELQRALKELSSDEVDDSGHQLIADYHRRCTDAAQGKGSLKDADAWARRQARRLRGAADEQLFVS